MKWAGRSACLPVCVREQLEVYVLEVGSARGAERPGTLVSASREQQTSRRALSTKLAY